jgi:SAM-dependent methyltransferase
LKQKEAIMQSEKPPASFWDQRFAEPEFVYGKEPNRYFQNLIDTLSPGRLLLPAEGQGRNAAYAASFGWEVDAFDSSTVARERALELAHENKVAFNYSISDLASFDAGADRYDLIALIFVHMPPELRMLVHRRLLQWLEPGGYILIEAFGKEQLQYKSGGPQNEAMLFSSEILQADFGGLNLLELSEVKDTLTEGKYHNGEAALVRMIAQKV